MPDESIHFALLTHSKSKYFENSRHANFDLLIKSYKTNSFNTQSNNVISDEDISRTQVFSQISDIFVLLKSMIVVRLKIISYSKSFFLTNYAHHCKEFYPLQCTFYCCSARIQLLWRVHPRCAFKRNSKLGLTNTLQYAYNIVQCRGGGIGRRTSLRG